MAEQPEKSQRTWIANIKDAPVAVSRLLKIPLEKKIILFRIIKDFFYNLEENMLKDKIKGYVNRVIRNSKTVNNLKYDLEEKFSTQKDSFLVQLDYVHNYERVKKSKVVYTCIVNNYDELPLYRYLNPEWDYVCFTDNTRGVLNSEIMEPGK